MMMFNVFSCSPLSLACSVAAHMALGMLWYSPILFGNVWMRYNNFQAKDLTMHVGHIIGGLFIGLATALAFGHLETLLGITSCRGSMELALICWAGFTATTHFNHVLWASKPIALWLLDVGYYAADFIVIACIMGQMR